IPANVSSAKLVQQLVDNYPDTPSLILEEEIDTLSASNKSDYGNFSHILRKGFSNESISSARKTDNSFIECSTPKLAIILSGTFKQVHGLIGNAEDGLYSRFLFYHFKTGPKWQDVSPCLDCINLSDYYKEKSRDYFELWNFIKQRDLHVELTAEQ